MRRRATVVLVCAVVCLAWSLTSAAKAASVAGPGDGGLKVSSTSVVIDPAGVAQQTSAQPGAAVPQKQAQKNVPAKKMSGCKVTDNVEYGKKIKEYTTEKFFITELVDHLPASTCVPSPEQALGHIVGAPDVLTYTKDINAYMRLLGEKSPRVKVYDIGKSEEGRDMLVVAVSDEANIANIDRYREITAKLADPRGLTQAEAQKLIAEGKPFYWTSGSIHSPETGAPEMLMELAYRLAVEESPFIQTIRKNSIVLITPIVEVDGHDREVDTYMFRKKHPDQPSYPLTWWGHYVAHDNNRDSMTQALALSRNMMGAFFQFHPTIFHDLHESVPYLYISTGTGPYNAWLDPITINEWQQLAYYEIDEMTKRGVIGIWTQGFYDGWAPNYLFYIANGHNSIGRFYETFGNGGADTRVRTLGGNQTSREWYRPNPPLPKVKWSMRNNTNMEESTILFGMYNLATNGQRFLDNFYRKGQRSVAKARTEGPAAWILPGDETRPGAQAELLNLLGLQGVEVHKATAAFKAQVPVAGRQPATGDQPSAVSRQENPGGRSGGQEPQGPSSRAGQNQPALAQDDSGRTQGQTQAGQQTREVTYPAGTYVVRMDQPYSRMADMLLDTQYYSARDPRSYDDTGWTLGALANVKTVRVMDQKVLDAPMAKTATPIAVAGAVNGAGKTYLINHNTENNLAAFRFKLASVKMEAAEDAFEADGKKFRAGTFLIHDVDRAQLEQAAKEFGLTVVATDAELKVKTHPLATPKIAILHNWSSTQNDGWFRIPLENLKIPYTYLADTKVRVTQNLKSEFDVIIVPPMGGAGAAGLNAMLRGIPARGDKPMPWKNTPEMPNLWAPGLDQTEDIRGGMGYTGLMNLERFVSDGGLLIAVQNSAYLPVGGGMTEMVQVSDARAMQAPGSVVLTTIDDKKSPITYGYDDRLYVYFRGGPILRVGTGGGGGFGGGGGGGGGEGEGGGRGSGRGSATDPDVVQARPYMAPERPVRRTPREQELYIPEETLEYARWSLPKAEEFPRVVLRFAPERELLLSGMITGGNEIAERPAVVDAQHGKGHVVLFANNPMWRNETSGSYFLLFNALLNYDHLDAGRVLPKLEPPAKAAGEQ